MADASGEGKKFAKKGAAEIIRWWTRTLRLRVAGLEAAARGKPSAGGPVASAGQLRAENAALKQECDALRLLLNQIQSYAPKIPYKRARGRRGSRPALCITVRHEPADASNIPTPRDHAGIHRAGAVCNGCGLWAVLDLAALVASGHGNVPLIKLPSGAEHAGGQVQVIGLWCQGGLMGSMTAGRVAEGVGGSPLHST